MKTACLVGLVFKPQTQMAASAVTAANAAPSTLQQELPGATRRRDSASVKPMSPVNPGSSNIFSRRSNAPDVAML